MSVKGVYLFNCLRLFPGHWSVSQIKGHGKKCEVFKPWEKSTDSILLLVVVVVGFVVFFFQNYSMPFFNKKRIAFKVYWLSWWDTMKIDKRCIVLGRSVTYSSVLNVVKLYINNDGNFASLLIKIVYPLCTHY